MSTFALLDFVKAFDKALTDFILKVNILKLIFSRVMLISIILQKTGFICDHPIYYHY